MLGSIQPRAVLILSHQMPSSTINMQNLPPQQHPQPAQQSSASSRMQTHVTQQTSSQSLATVAGSAVLENSPEVDMDDLSKIERARMKARERKRKQRAKLTPAQRVSNHLVFFSVAV